MNSPNFTFTNNYAIVGITKILYNIWLEPLCTGKGTYWYDVNDASEIGFQYKKVSDSNWTSVMIAQDQSGFSSSYDIHYSVSEPQDESNYHASSMAPSSALTEWKILYPINIVIKNLLPNTQYNVRSYYKDLNGNTHTYNQQQVTTRKKVQNSETNLNLTYSKALLQWLGLNEDDYMESSYYIQDQNKFQIGIDIINSMVNFSKLTYGNYDIGVQIIPNKNDGTGGEAGKPMDLQWTMRSEEKTAVSTLIHETSHIVFNCEDLEISRGSGLEYLDSITKFMEFATHVPQAIWKWQGGNHNYPGMNVSIKSYFDNHLVVYAWTITDDNYNDD